MTSRPGFLVAQDAPDDAKEAYGVWVTGVLNLISERQWAAAIAVIRSEHHPWLKHFPYTIYADQMIDIYAQRFSELGAWKFESGTYEEVLISACQHPEGPRLGAIRCMIDLGMLYKHFHRYEDAASLHHTARNLDPAGYLAAGGPANPWAL